MRVLSGFVTLSVFLFTSLAPQPQYASALERRSTQIYDARRLQRQNSQPVAMAEKQIARDRLKPAVSVQHEPLRPTMATHPRAKLLRQNSMPGVPREAAKAMRQTQSSPADNTAANTMQIVADHTAKRQYVERGRGVASAVEAHLYHVVTKDRAEKGLASVNAGQTAAARDALHKAWEYQEKARGAEHATAEHTQNYRQARLDKAKMEIAGLRPQPPTEVKARVNLNL